MSIQICTISASLRTLSDTSPTAPVAELVVRNPKPFFHGVEFVPQFELRATFNQTTGDASLPVMETETPGVKLEIYVVITEGIRKRVIRMKPAEIPNGATADLADITRPDEYSTY